MVPGYNIISEASLYKHPIRNESGYTYCTLCLNNGEDKSFYSGHVLKEKSGRILCPVLRRHTCPFCGQSGDNAHTEKYCPIPPHLREKRAPQTKISKWNPSAVQSRYVEDPAGQHKPVLMPPPMMKGAATPRIHNNSYLKTGETPTIGIKTNIQGQFRIFGSQQTIPVNRTVDVPSQSLMNDKQQWAPTQLTGYMGPMANDQKLRYYQALNSNRDLYNEQLQHTGRVAVTPDAIDQRQQFYHEARNEQYQQQQRCQERSHGLQMMERPSCVPWKGSQSSMTPPDSPDSLSPMSYKEVSPTRPFRNVEQQTALLYKDQHPARYISGVDYRQTRNLTDGQNFRFDAEQLTFIEKLQQLDQLQRNHAMDEEQRLKRVLMENRALEQERIIMENRMAEFTIIQKKGNLDSVQNSGDLLHALKPENNQNINLAKFWHVKP